MPPETQVSTPGQAPAQASPPVAQPAATPAPQARPNTQGTPPRNPFDRSAATPAKAASNYRIGEKEYSEKDLRDALESHQTRTKWQGSLGEKEKALAGRAALFDRLEGIASRLEQSGQGGRVDIGAAKEAAAAGGDEDDILKAFADDEDLESPDMQRLVKWMDRVVTHRAKPLLDGQRLRQKTEAELAQAEKTKQEREQFDTHVADTAKRFGVSARELKGVIFERGVNSLEDIIDYATELSKEKAGGAGDGGNGTGSEPKPKVGTSELGPAAGAPSTAITRGPKPPRVGSPEFKQSIVDLAKAAGRSR